MKADESNVTGLFAQQIGQYCIPHYQRPQAWKVDKHWEPLWADVESKANDWLNDVAPNQHYLGAIVLAKRPKIGVRGMDRYLVIDGQQRLSTLQYLLKALLLVTEEVNYIDGAISLKQELYNTNQSMMDRPEVQTHKLWPTFRDRESHKSVMSATTFAALRDEFPSSFTNAGNLYVHGKHPRPLEATCFFYQKIHDWIEDLAGSEQKEKGVEAVRMAITQSLQLIILWLEKTDDPQVIFECLNGRGEPLRSTDLIKNFIFMTAETAAEGGSEDITEESTLFKHWSQFEQPIWLDGVTRGRLTQTRIEWLIYYCLQAEIGQDLDISRTYESYQRWAAPPSGRKLPASEQIATLSEYGGNLLSFIGEDQGKSIGRLGKIAQRLDVTTVSAVALAIAKNCSEVDQEEMFRALASYLVRRETCGLTKKAYNVIFLSLLKELKQNGFTLKVLSDYLSSLNGEASVWPDDTRFSHAIETRSIYGSGGALNICRLLLSTAAHQIGANHASETQWSPDWTQLHIEHLMPQSWYEHWPLSDDTFAFAEECNSLRMAEQGTEAAGRFGLIETRERLKNTLGNLTILNKEINLSIKNHSWGSKRVEIGEATQLRMNFDIVGELAWDEIKIRDRGRSLGAMLAEVWVSPS